MRRFATLLAFAGFAAASQVAAAPITHTVCDEQRGYDFPDGGDDFGSTVTPLPGLEQTESCVGALLGEITFDADTGRMSAFDLTTDTIAVLSGVAQLALIEVVPSGPFDLGDWLFRIGVAEDYLGIGAGYETFEVMTLYFENASADEFRYYSTNIVTGFDFNGEPETTFVEGFYQEVAMPAVPLPAGAVLLLTGVAGFAAMRRKSQVAAVSPASFSP